jgi:hypothetical protein
VFRNAPLPEFNIPGLSGSPGRKAPPTTAQLRRETQPVTRLEDCAAFIEVDNGDAYFCLARVDTGSGNVAIAERVPWESFDNFEVGSHREWFRDRSSSSDMTDWGVIIAQSSVGRVLRVAESVRDHAQLVELLAVLQNAFVAPRIRLLRAIREASQPGPQHGGSTPESVPVIS